MQIGSSVQQLVRVLVGIHILLIFEHVLLSCARLPYI